MKINFFMKPKNLMKCRPTIGHRRFSDYRQNLQKAGVLLYKYTNGHVLSDKDIQIRNQLLAQHFEKNKLYWQNESHRLGQVVETLDKKLHDHRKNNLEIRSGDLGSLTADLEIVKQLETAKQELNDHTRMNIRDIMLKY